jgi:hypothetical protein
MVRAKALASPSSVRGSYAGSYVFSSETVFTPDEVANNPTYRDEQCEYQ